MHFFEVIVAFNVAESKLSFPDFIKKLESVGVMIDFDFTKLPEECLPNLCLSCKIYVGTLYARNQSLFVDEFVKHCKKESFGDFLSFAIEWMYRMKVKNIKKMVNKVKELNLEHESLECFLEHADKLIGEYEAYKKNTPKSTRDLIHNSNAESDDSDG
jgi:hypothetical protein